ncbi:cathepsin B-like cysteine proteinase 4 [Halichondria panicea]|uniref:cathepsin B-like cysteine proteinase 4 n=1 Tax=Halichondria panicea TaxID=6063 RepID=UPI00312B4251
MVHANIILYARINKVMNIVVLVLSALVVATAATELITGRSSRWDQMIQDHETRHKRQAREWQTIFEPCTLGDVTRFDQLGRRNSGLLAPVGNQGCCGSCWAFAAAHAVSDTRNLAAGRRLDLLSAQYTARCATNDTRTSGYGCCGDDPVNALKHYRHTGVATDVCLPYNELSSLPPTGYTGNYKAANPLTCFSTCADGSAFDPISITIDDINTLKTYNEGTIINALSNGHVVVTPIELNTDVYRYRCGVLTPSDPPLEILKYHSVVIVDYGTTDTGTNFWVIKNSYGSNRGESGYYRVRRGQGIFGIGNYHMHIPLLSPDSMLLPSDPTTETQKTCALEAVANPQNNDITMSAVEFALQGLADNQRVQCGFPPNGEAATGINLISFNSAGIQLVAGTMVELIVDVSLEGCGANVTKTLDLTVFINLDGTFTLTDYNTAKILTASMLLMFAMVMINLVINN